MRDLDLVILKYEKHLNEYGIVNLTAYKGRLQFFWSKLEKLAKECEVTPIQYIAVLESNWRELYEWVEMDHYIYMIKEVYRLQEQNNV